MAVKIHGKDYITVAERVAEFHEKHKEDRKSIITELLKFEDSIVVMKASVYINEETYVGHAYEDIGSSKINETSALENCETSAIGRALAGAGFAGTEYASADELVSALEKQKDGYVAKTPQKKAGGGLPSDKQKWLIMKLNKEKEYLGEEDMKLKVDNMTTKAEASEMIETLQNYSASDSDDLF